MKIRKLISL